MTVRDRAGLLNEITNRLPTGTGDITAADLRSVLTDMVDSLELAPVVGTHTRYAVWTNSASTPSAAEFQAGDTSQGDEITVRATPAGRTYLHFAELANDINDIRETGSAFSSRNLFSDTPAQRSIGGVQHFVYSSRFALNPYTDPQSWTLTTS